jgi:hypothetical protein
MSHGDRARRETWWASFWHDWRRLNTYMMVVAVVALSLKVRWVYFLRDPDPWLLHPRYFSRWIPPQSMRVRRPVSLHFAPSESTSGGHPNRPVVTGLHEGLTPWPVESARSDAPRVVGAGDDPDAGVLSSDHAGRWNADSGTHAIVRARTA